MRNIIAVMLILCVTPICALSQGKITQDPNSPEAKAKAAAKVSNAADHRLTQKVTYHVTHRSVVNILADLSKVTEVAFSAGRNEADWQVRDRRMNIFTKETTLADLLNSIGRVMKFKWQISGHGEKTTYRLYMDRKSLLDAETQALRQEEKAEKQLAENRESMLNSLGDLDKLSPQELDTLKTESPFKYVMASSGLAGSLDRFLGNVPSAADALASGQELSLNSKDLSPAAQEAIIQSMQSLLSLAAKMNPSETDLAMPSDIYSNMDKFVVKFNSNINGIKTSATNDLVLGNMSIRYGDSHLLFMPLFDPNSKLAQLLGKAIIQCEKDGKPIDEIIAGMNDEFTAAETSQKKETIPGDPVIKHSQDSALEAKIKLDPKAEKLALIQSSIADASDFSVVSDSFGINQGQLKSGGDEIALKDVLEKIAEGFHYNWDKHSTILEFRDRNWFRKRNAQIPQAWIDAWNETLKRTGTLDIGDLARIALLTQEQLNANILTDDDLARCEVPSLIYPSRNLLRLYGGMTESQRLAVFSQSGLELNKLSAEQWKLAEEIITQRKSAYLQNNETRVTLAGTVSTKECQKEYTFTVTTTKNLPPIKWTVVTPKYQPKPKSSEPPISDEKPS